MTAVVFSLDFLFSRKTIYGLFKKKTFFNFYVEFSRWRRLHEMLEPLIGYRRPCFWQEGGGGRCFSCRLKWRRKIRALFAFAKPNAMGFFVWLTNWLACGGVGSQQTSKFPCLATSDSLEHFFLICIYFFRFPYSSTFFVVYVKLFLAEEKKLNLFS